EAEVTGYDDGYGLLHLQPQGVLTILKVSSPQLPIGTPVRLRVLAQDVSLTLSRQQDTSILNICPVVVKAIEPNSTSQMTVLMTLGEYPLLARITRKSADNLNLFVGQRLFAQIKSVALMS